MSNAVSKGSVGTAMSRGGGGEGQVAQRSLEEQGALQ